MAERCRILFTDLDGTLLDHHTYLPGPALEALRALQAHRVAVIPATSKTEAELRPLVRRWGLRDGWIAENGAVVRTRWARRWARLRRPARAYPRLPYRLIRRELRRAAAAVGAEVTGYGDLTDAQVAQLTGLAVPAAAAARRRQWTETFLLVRGDLAALVSQLRGRGVRVVAGGRFLTASGAHDKGTAVRAVLSRRAATSWAVGDAPNDAPMLAATDHAFLVRAHHGGWADLDVPGLTRLDGVGPQGFVQAAHAVLR